MKKKTLLHLILAFLLIGVFVSCKKDKEDEYTIENKSVTGDLNYVRTAFVPITVDPVTQQPLSASMVFEGTGTTSDLGDLNLISSFNFDFVTGQGSDFQTTYTGASASDGFTSTGTSQMQQDGSIIITELFTGGKGKFAKIKGGGETKVILTPNGDSATGEATWTVTY
jgi:hypothetical protein